MSETKNKTLDNGGYSPAEITCRGCFGPCGVCAPPSLRTATAEPGQQQNALSYARGLLEGYEQAFVSLGQYGKIKGEQVLILVGNPQTVKALQDIIGLPGQADGQACFKDVIFTADELPF